MIYYSVHGKLYCFIFNILNQIKIGLNAVMFKNNCFLLLLVCSESFCRPAF